MACLFLQRGEDCHCSDSYGALGITSGCTTMCSVNDQYLCGGWLKNHLYYIGGESKKVIRVLNISACTIYSYLKVLEMEKLHLNSF